MRRLHQKTVNGEKFGLSEEKIKLLKKLDFIFEFDDLPERFSFHERYQWLLKFKEEHGTFAPSRGCIKYFVLYILCSSEPAVRAINISTPLSPSLAQDM